jgi:ABC-2 type transport system ATP-binding protein
MIEIRKVSKSYNKGAVRAVDDLDLVIEPGEIFGFLGPNGAGKTTTIKLIVGILKPDSGSILINGIDNQAQPLKCKSMMTYVPDYPAVYERLTGMEYLNFIGDVYSVPRRDRIERIDKWQQTFELGPAMTGPIQSYSHGMRQKIVLMAALLPEPEMMILDEPMVGLDPRAAHNLKELMRERCKAGKTVFLSTHIMEVAEKLCDRIGIINKGKLVASGTMEELQALNQNEQSLEHIFLELTEK